ncbi:hypothetical protein [Bosea sp. (in: a-proteobacteria)]|jgi:hypothetical protein|uniref:hypothetical protein n=1 Tax=Bosea sp. (in: a-proteobacteria) TaxID=1871050 RepID=UPI003564D56D
MIEPLGDKSDRATVRFFKRDHLMIVAVRQALAGHRNNCIVASHSPKEGVKVSNIGEPPRKDAASSSPAHGDYPASTSPAMATDSPVSKQWNSAFLDDLDAAVRLKSYLVGRGVVVPNQAITTIAELEDRYSSELDDLRLAAQKGR